MKRFFMGLMAILACLGAAAATTTTIWEGSFDSKRAGKYWGRTLSIGAAKFLDVQAGDKMTFSLTKNSETDGEMQLQMTDTDWESITDGDYLVVSPGEYVYTFTASSAQKCKTGINIKGQNFSMTKITLTTANSGGQTGGDIQGSFKVSGRKILDANNNEFIMRGCNYSWCWQRGHEGTVIPAAKRIGCNIIRIQLGDGKQYYKPSKDELEYLIQLCERNRIVAMFNTHDETGSDNYSDLERAAKFWLEMKDVLNKHTATVIVNISNEWFGSWNKASEWADGYKKVIPMLRDGGLKNMLVVDCAGYGQWPASIFQRGNEVAATDNLKNTVLSMHFYDDAASSDSKVQDNIDNALRLNVPVIIGEFAYKHKGRNVAWQKILDYATEKSMGYLVWSWTGNGSGTEDCDMFGGYDDSDWKPNGTYCIKGRNGVAQTSKECSIFAGYNPVEPDPDPVDPDPVDPDDPVDYSVDGTHSLNPAGDPKNWKNEIEIPASVFQKATTSSVIRFHLASNDGAQMQFALKMGSDWTWTQIGDYYDVYATPYDLHIADVEQMTADTDYQVDPATVVSGLKDHGLYIKGKAFTLAKVELLNKKTDAIDEVEAPAELDPEAPVEYYNLQGIRVAEPQAGQLYIVRQGKIVKKLVK